MGNDGEDSTGSPDTSPATPGTAQPSVPVPPELDTDALPIDEVFALLQNERRRNVLHYLADREADAGPVAIGELAEQLAAWETGTPVAQLTSDERKRVYVSLYQVHLPKMDDMDVIRFNKPRGTIERGENADICYWYLARAADEDDEPRPWYRYYAVLSAIGAGSLAGARWLQPQTTVPLVEIAAVGILIAYCGCTGWYWWSRRTLNATEPRTSA